MIYRENAFFFFYLIFKKWKDLFVIANRGKGDSVILNPNLRKGF